MPRPSAIFLTHDHDDHVEPRSLLSLPKDVPVIVPSRRNRKAYYYDYQALLRDTDKTISDVALDVGIQDPHYFSRVFKKVVGYNPKEFRRTV